MKRKSLSNVLCMLCVVVLFISSVFMGVSRISAAEKDLKEVEPILTITKPGSFPGFKKGTEGKLGGFRLVGYEDVALKGTAKVSPCDNEIMKMDEDGNYQAISEGTLAAFKCTFTISDDSIKELEDKYGIKLTRKEAYYAGIIYVSENVEDERNYTVYRLYNHNSGEHFYTYDSNEIKNLETAGWKNEGVAWKAPAISDNPVYRLYNPNAGDHHYTMSADEKDNLVKAGWNYEGIGWYSDDAKGVELYRLYNPNAVAGSHHYTVSEAEKENLVKAGWKDEAIAWYGR